MSTNRNTFSLRPHSTLPTLLSRTIGYVNTENMLRTSMNFLLRDNLYQTEKPYLCLFETPAGFSKTNIRLSKRKDLIIKDIRGLESRFSLRSHGFAIMCMTSKLSYDDFGDNSKIKNQYLSEVAERLRCFCGASRVQIFEHVVSINHFSYIRTLSVVYINCYNV
jgi:hypothetical protein